MLRQQVLAEVRRLARPLPHGVTLDSTLAEAGLDSLGRMELLAALECRLGFRLPESLGPELRTISEVTDAIWQHARRADASTLAFGRPIEPRDEPTAPDDIPVEHYDVARFPEWTALARDAQRQERLGMVNPYFLTQEGLPGRRVRVDGRELIDFASYDYLGLASDARVVAAAQAAIERYGTTVSASRLVSGERALHQELERALAGWLGTEDAIVMVSGHATNVTAIGHLLSEDDLVLHDALAHNSIVQGCRLSGARRLAFRHNDTEALDRLLTSLRGHYRRALVAIEGLYSMDGDVPDLARFVEIKRRHKALLLVDEAHSLGVLGERGRGIGETLHEGVGSRFRDVDDVVVPPNAFVTKSTPDPFPKPRSLEPEARTPESVDLWMGTLSKALASCGGYIAGRRELVQYLKYTAPGFVYSVGISPPNAAAALESLRVLEAEPWRVADLTRAGSELCSAGQAAWARRGPVPGHARRAGPRRRCGRVPQAVARPGEPGHLVPSDPAPGGAGRLVATAVLRDRHPLAAADSPGRGRHRGSAGAAPTRIAPRGSELASGVWRLGRRFGIFAKARQAAVAADL